ncbi:MAG TPA: hypothetical protein V6C97_01755 [Oculatellaceae cyanobacterium]
MLFSYISNCAAKFFRGRQSETVTMTDEAITRTVSSGETESVRFDDLEEVYIVTTDQGPFVEDLFYVLKGHHGGTIIGQEWASRVGLMERLFKLPNLNLEQIVQAMASIDNHAFLIWREDWA